MGSAMETRGFRFFSQKNHGLGSEAHRASLGSNMMSEEDPEPPGRCRQKARCLDVLQYGALDVRNTVLRAARRAQAERPGGCVPQVPPPPRLSGRSRSLLGKEL